MADILVVDDDRVSTAVLAAALGRAGHAVRVAGDGEEALVQVRARAPELVVTDVLMPRMDGWRLAQALRCDPASALLPVIFLTILNDEQHRLRGFGLGADDYIAKPVNLDELRFRIARSLSRAEGAARAAQRGLDVGVTFVGDVGQLGGAALLSLLASERKSGILRLIRGDELVTVWVRTGLLTAASGPGLAGVDAVYEALGWAHGTFEFETGEPTEPPADGAIQASLTFVLMEAARRLDERLADPLGRGAG